MATSEFLSDADVFGTAPKSTGVKSPESTGTFLSDDEVFGGGKKKPDAIDQGAIDQASFKGQAKSVLKDVLGYTLGVGGQLEDMLASVPRVFSIPGSTGVIARGTAAGEKPTDIAQGALDYQSQFLPEWTQGAYGKIAKALGPEVEDYYNKNGIGKFLEKFGQRIEENSHKLEEHTGIPAAYTQLAINQGMDLLGAHGTLSGVKAGLVERADAARAKFQKDFTARQNTPAEIVPETQEAITLRERADAATSSAKSAQAKQAEWKTQQDSESVAAQKQTEWAQNYQGPALDERFQPSGERGRFAAEEGQVELKNQGAVPAEGKALDETSTAQAKVDAGHSFDLTAEDKIKLREDRLWEEEKTRMEGLEKKALVLPDEETGFIPKLALAGGIGLAAYGLSKEDNDSIVAAAPLLAAARIKALPEGKYELRLTKAENNFFDSVHKNTGDLQEFKNEVPDVLYKDGKLHAESAEAVSRLQAYVDRTVALNERERLPPSFYSNKFASLAKSQNGSIDPELLKTMGKVGLSALAGAVASTLTTKDSALGDSVLGALTGATIATPFGKQAMQKTLRAADSGLGLISTRILNMDPQLHWAHIKMELSTIKRTYDAIKTGDAFFTELGKLKKDGGEIERALFNNDPAQVKTELRKAGKEYTIPMYEALTAKLREIGGEAQKLGRFKELREGYFPRIVKDFAGLKEVLKQEARKGLDKAMYEAESASLKSNNRPMTDEERTKVVENFMRKDVKGSFLPNYAKARKIDTVTDAMQPFYYSPVDSFHRTVRSAIQDIETAKFFGKDLVDKKENGKTYVDTDKSIWALVEDKIRTGKLSNEQASELRDIENARFKGGEKPMWGPFQDAKNLFSAGLLGNIVAATGQYADLGSIVAAHGMKPMLGAVLDKVKGASQVKPSDLGLIDHVSEEFISNRWSQKVVNWAFSHSLLGKNLSFAGADLNMKEVAMNAVLRKGQAWAWNNDSRLADKYKEALGDDYQKLVEGLKNKELTPEVSAYVFNELSRTQPTSKLEMPEWALNNPNGRLLYSMKSWANKQADFIRRESYNEIKKRDKASVAKGLGMLLKYGAAAGVSGATAAQVQNWMLGRDDALDTNAVLENMAKTFALNSYTRDKAAKGDIAQAMVDTATPPYKMFDDIYKGVRFGDPKIIRYLPDVGPILYAHLFGGADKHNKQVARDAAKAEREDTPPPEKMKNLKGISLEDTRGARFTDSRGDLPGVSNREEFAADRINSNISKNPKYQALLKEQEFIKDRINKSFGTRNRRRLEGDFDTQRNLRFQAEEASRKAKRKLFI